MFDTCGYQRFTADAVLKASGTPVAVYGLDIDSKASGAGKVILYDGTSATGTKLISATGVSDDDLSVDLGKGRVFSSGCFVDIDTNCDAVVVWYKALT